MPIAGREIHFAKSPAVPNRKTAKFTEITALFFILSLHSYPFFQL